MGAVIGHGDAVEARRQRALGQIECDDALPALADVDPDRVVDGVLVRGRAGNNLTPRFLAMVVATVLRRVLPRIHRRPYGIGAEAAQHRQQRLCVRLTNCGQNGKLSLAHPCVQKVCVHTVKEQAERLCSRQLVILLPGSFCR
jgi:hypothetical protein